MAQYFYDLRIGKPGHLPYFLGGDIAPSQFQYIGYTQEECVLMYDIESGFNLANFKGLGQVKNIDILIRYRMVSDHNSTNAINSGSVGAAIRLPQEINSREGGYYSTPSYNTWFTSQWFNPMGGNHTRIDSGGVSSQIDARTAPARYLTDRYFRFRAADSMFYTKIWWEDEAEPSEWGIVTEHFGNEDPGYAGFYFTGGSDAGNAIRIKYVSVGTDGDVPPMAPTYSPRVIEGILRAPNNSPAEGQVVRALHTPTGYVLDETVSDSNGYYQLSLNIPHDEDITVVAQGNRVSGWNDKAMAVYPSV